MNQVKYESERDYCCRNEMVDNPRGWQTGAMYATGLGEDESGGDAIVMTTPSGIPTLSSTSSSWADAFKSAVPILASVYQQRQLTKMNVARINRNQAPLTAQEYATTYQPPSAQVQFGATQDAKRLMLYAALGVAALVGLRAAKVI